jgi:hypothetical protein
LGTGLLDEGSGMKGVVWGLFGLLGALWSLLAWVLHGIAGSGSAAVVTVSRWLDIEPSSTQWLADGLAMAGGLAQAMVIIVWLVGVGLLGLFGWMGSRAVEGMEDAGRELRRDARVRGQGPVIDGEMTASRVDPVVTVGRVDPAGTVGRVDPAGRDGNGPARPG